MNGPGGYFGLHLLALEDCLGGGFGMQFPSSLIWMNHEHSRTSMDRQHLTDWARRRIERRDYFEEEGLRCLEATVREAEAGQGPTLFDFLVDLLTNAPSGQLLLERT